MQQEGRWVPMVYCQYCVHCCCCNQNPRLSPRQHQYVVRTVVSACASMHAYSSHCWVLDPKATHKHALCRLHTAWCVVNQTNTKLQHSSSSCARVHHHHARQTDRGGNTTQ